MTLTKKENILICDDDPITHQTLQIILHEKYSLFYASTPKMAVEILEKSQIAILLLDIQIEAQEDGIDLLKLVRLNFPTTEVIIVSGQRNVQLVKCAIQLGARDYVLKDTPPEDLLHTIDMALNYRQLIIQNQQTAFEVEANQNKNEIIGTSPILDKLKNTIEKFKKGQANITIYGETGSGKEMAAKQLRKRHKNGNLEPFISVDSATIHESLAESILFGHEKGAFTGALQSKKGLFEEANGGILYFDEIANMSIDIQKKLLRVIQEKEVLRVGSNIRIPVEIRIVAATNKSLEVLVKQGDFLEDLFQRISVLPLKIPALRERTEDIPELLNYFAKKNAIDGRVLSFSKPAIELLQKYDWPGNIRELANLVAYLSVVLEHGEIGPDNLPEKITQSVKGLTKDTHSIEKPIENSEMIPDPKTIAKDFDRLKFSYEKRLLQELYNFSNGNVTSIARALNADRPTLHLKLVTMGIHKPKTLNQNIFN